MANGDNKTLPSGVKAEINENTGIIFDDNTASNVRKQAQKANTKIFKQYGKLARDHFQSIMPEIKKGQSENRMRDKQLGTYRGVYKTGGKVMKKKYGGDIKRYAQPRKANSS